MSLRWWAVYRGGEYIEHVLAASGERALDVVSEREGIPLAELDAVDHGSMERSGLAMLPFYSMELGPGFRFPGPNDAGGPVGADRGETGGTTRGDPRLWPDRCRPAGGGDP